MVMVDQLIQIYNLGAQEQLMTQRLQGSCKGLNGNFPENFLNIRLLLIPSDILKLLLLTFQVVLQIQTSHVH